MPDSVRHGRGVRVQTLHPAAAAAAEQRSPARPAESADSGGAPPPLSPSGLAAPCEPPPPHSSSSSSSSSSAVLMSEHLDGRLGGVAATAARRQLVEWLEPAPPDEVLALRREYEAMIEVSPAAQLQPAASQPHHAEPHRRRYRSARQN
jgi:hypothetical protein